jgi:hypothetical protein
MITANQLRAARALLNIDQRQMAELAYLSVPTIQRMEASDGVVRESCLPRGPWSGRDECMIIAAMGRLGRSAATCASTD